MKDLAWLRPADTRVDEDVQRRLDMTHVNKIAKQYDPLLFGLGHVSIRTDGRYYVLDAQHRCEAAKIAGQGDVPVMFKVYRGLSISDEADLFLKLNGNKKPVNSICSFNIAVKAGHPVNVDIVRILDRYGLQVAAAQKSGGIAAVVALIHIYHGKVGTRPVDPDATKQTAREHLLSRTLHVLTTAWRKDRSAFDALLMKGVAGMLNKHGAAIDGHRLAKALAKQGTADQTIGRIRSLQNIARKSGTMAAVEILEGIYNYGRTAGKRLEA